LREGRRRRRRRRRRNERCSEKCYTYYKEREKSKIYCSEGS
jgi:hypothetical protein